MPLYRAYISYIYIFAKQFEIFFFNRIFLNIALYFAETVSQPEKRRLAETSYNNNSACSFDIDFVIFKKSLEPCRRIFRLYPLYFPFF
jgi:hypothetical protein